MLPSGVIDSSQKFLSRIVSLEMLQLLSATSIEPYSHSVVGWHVGGGWGIPEAGRLPREAGESQVVALGARAWGWVKGLAVSLFLLLDLFLCSACYPCSHQCRARRGWEAAPSHHGAFLSTHWAQSTARRGLCGQVFVSAQWPLS